MASVLDEARRLNRLGINTLPTRRGKKSPGLPSWKKFQRDERTRDYIDAWFGTGSQYVGIWVVTGSASAVLVLDCDSPEADAFWRARIGNEMDATTCVKTHKGHHYWFALDPGAKIKSWAVHEGAISFDVKADGGGVMAPPSPHPDGGFYAWVRDIGALQPAPLVLCDGGKAYASVDAQGELLPEAEEPHGLVAPPVSNTRSLLEQLLANKPDEGGRNDWLIRVCGHYAKSIPFHDAYLATVRMANGSLDHPLDDDEVEKTAESAWQSEQAKGLDTVEALREQGVVAGEPEESNGWLVGAEAALLCPALVGPKGDQHEVLQPWGDFNIETLGIIKSTETVDYLVRLTTRHESVECKLSGATMGSGRDLAVWLAARRASIGAPVGDLHAKMAAQTRLLRYVSSQPAPTYRSVRALGWSDEVGGYIVHEGIIRAGATEPAPFDDVRPAPDLVGWAPYRYGFVGTRAEAQGVLAEVMTFHEDEVCAVYGAWWAACFLKQQIMSRTSLFPFMALEAPSESGKTTGFFALMMQLSGNTEGHGEYTKAVLRDRVSAHLNGPVWVDDVTNPADVLDLIRQATSGGSRSKKTEDRHTQETVQLVAPIVMSAEGLQALATEKALSDRAIMLDVPSPVGRMSLRDPARSQWDDVTALMLQWRRDLTQVSGHFVAMALECLDMVEALPALRPAGGGRFNDSMAILRLGARLLVAMGVDAVVVETVDAWVAARADKYDPNANLLTTAILPWAWRELGYPESANHGVVVFRDPRDRCVYYREEALADMWLRRHGLTERERQLGSLTSLRGQRVRLGGSGHGANRRVSKGSDRKVRYQSLGLDQSAAVAEASGWTDVDEDALL